MTTPLTDPPTLRAPLGRPSASHRRPVAPVDLADGILLAALPLCAVGLSRSSALLSLVPAMAWLPWLVLGLAAGVIIDRAGRRLVGAAARAARVVLLVAMAVLATTDQSALWPLLAAAAAAFALAITLLSASPPLVEDESRRPAPSPLAVALRAERLRSAQREAAGVAHRTEMTERLVRVGLHHLR